MPVVQDATEWVMRSRLTDITLTLVFVLSMLAVDIVRAGYTDTGSDLEPVKTTGSISY